MAIFSRKKSKAKKEEEEAKSAAAKAAALAKKPQRGRNGKIIVPVEDPSSDPGHDIPAPSQLPRDFHSPQIRQRASNCDRGHSFEEEHPNDNGKHDYFDPHSSGDSGYATPGPDYQGNSRPLSPTRYLPVPAKSSSRLTLGEELAQEAVFADHSDEGSNRQQMHGHRTLKTSRSLQTMQQHAGLNHSSSRAARPSQPYQYQDGRQQRLIQQSMPMRPSSVPAQPLQSRLERMQSLGAQRGRLPGKADETVPSPARDDPVPSLSILNGFKVNKRGLILNEEGDPIGELSEGDILDCVRERANAYGEVMDEYGRIVGKVRVLSTIPASPTLRRSMTSASAWEQRRDVSSLPPLSSQRTAGAYASFDEGQPSLPAQDPQTSRQEPVEGEYPSLSARNASGDDYNDYNEQEAHMSMTPHGVGELEMHQSQGPERAAHQQAFISDSSVVGSSIHRSESLPSVPETHSTAEIALSEDGSTTSGSAHQAAAEVESEPDHSAEKAKQPQLVMHADKMMTSQTAGSTKSVAFAAPAEGSLGMPATTPALGRSVSEQGLLPMGLPPVPQVPKNFLNGQPAGLFTPSNRAKAAPLPAFPGRGLTVGLAGGGFNGPMPGIQNRRTTMPAYASQGMSSLNAHPALSKSRNSTPLVRSPLSTHGKLCQFTNQYLFNSKEYTADIS